MTIDKKNILIIVSEDWYFYTHRLELAIEGISRGHKIVLLSNYNSHRSLIENEGIETRDLGDFRSKLSLFGEFKNIYNLYKSVKSFKPDIIHSVSIKISIYTAIINLFIKPNKLLVAISGLGFFYTSKKKSSNFVRIFLNILIRIFLTNNRTKIIVQNPEDYKKLIKLKVNKKNISLIKGVGVNLDKFKKIEICNEKPKILLACRLLWSKGIKTFSECAKIINENEYQAEFILAGRVDDKNPDAVSIEDINQFKDKIRWVGNIDVMHEEMKKYDIFLFPSLYGEGVPKILLEAASTSIPIITYDVPGCREVVKNNISGYLVQSGNINELVSKLQYLITYPDVRKSMGANGRLIVEKDFSSSFICSQTIKLWEED